MTSRVTYEYKVVDKNVYPATPADRVGFITTDAGRAPGRCYGVCAQHNVAAVSLLLNFSMLMQQHCSNKVQPESRQRRQSSCHSVFFFRPTAASHRVAVSLQLNNLTIMSSG